MKKPFIVAAACGAFALAGVVVLRARSPEPQAPDAPARRDASVLPTQLHAIQPLPEGIALAPERVALGRKLFHDPGLSKDGTISCSSCHDLSRGGADNRKVSIGVGGAEGDINAPTVFNSGLNFKQFWDGRADSLEDQVGGPVTNPREMASNWPDVLQMLRRDSEYVAMFAAAYESGVTEDNVRNAIGTFERSLLTPGSRFDKYLQGDDDALSTDEKRGYELFQELGCITCHQGVNLGGNSFQTFGLVHNYFADRGQTSKADLGRFNVTGKERDKYKFKVPTLRNVSKTGPYLHDGSAATIEEAVQIMARYQLGQELEPEEVEMMVKFMRTLDGDYGG